MLRGWDPTRLPKRGRISRTKIDTSVSLLVLPLNASPSLDVVLSRAAELGAQVLLPKLELPRDIGFIAQIVDCEGNRIGLHSPQA